MKRLLLALALFLLPSLAQAQAQTVPTQGVAPLETLAKQAIIVDASTGAILYTKDADAQMPTSSMSKVMSMYMVFDAIKKSKLTLDQLVPVSEYAWKQEGSRTFLNIGQQVKVEDLIRGVIIQSGNDAAVALAEAVAGTEASFAEMMTAKAKELGMTNSHFKNATGLPDPQHYSTARDLATMALALIRDFPEHYHYDAETEFTFNNIKQGNRNPLLYRNMGVDGMKTGHTEIAGYGMIASALRENRRVIVVVNGLSSMQERADESAKLLDWAYREYGVYTLVSAGQQLGEAKVWLGEQKTVPVAADKNLMMSLPRGVRENVKISMSLAETTEAPVAKGQVLGKATVSAPGMNALEVPIVAATDVPRLGFFACLIAKFKRMVGKD